MSVKRIPFGSIKGFNVLIEIPKGSSVKYEYNKETEEFTANFFFEDGFVYPWNYGFVARTLAEDGDSLDVILLGTEAIERATVVKCEAIGIIKLIDRDKPDHKVIAVPFGHPLAERQLNSEDLIEITKGIIATAEEMARQKQKTIVIGEVLGRDEAETEIGQAHEAYNRNRGRS